VQLLLHCSTSGLLIAPAAAAAATLRPTAASLRSVPQYTRQSSRAGCIVAREINKLETREDYDALISAAKAENRVVVIKFYASWCRACKAMAPKFARLVDDWPEIEFYEILFDNNKKLCKELGIKILPYMEIIAGEAGKTESFTCGPSKISLLVSKLEDTAEKLCLVDSVECTDVSQLLESAE